MSTATPPRPFRARIRSRSWSGWTTACLSTWAASSSNDTAGHRGGREGCAPAGVTYSMLDHCLSTMEASSSNDSRAPGREVRTVHLPWTLTSYWTTSSLSPGFQSAVMTRQGRMLELFTCLGHLHHTGPPALCYLGCYQQ